MSSKHLLDDVASDLDAAQRLLADPPNRLAAFHVQQAAEKLVKALRLHRGLFATAEHNIEALVEELPADDAWRAKLLPLEAASAFATTYRYPAPSGRRKPEPPRDELLEWIRRIEALTDEARTDLLGKK